MKKTIIIAAIIISSGLTAYCFSTTQTKANTSLKIKVNKADFAAKSINAPKADIATAD